MRIISSAIMGCMLLFITACTTVTSDIKVDAEVSPTANISGYKRYAWLGRASIINDPVGQWEPLQFNADSEIKWLIDRELRRRGITEVRDKPDMYVFYAAGIDMEALQLKKDPDVDIELLTNVPQGALLIALIDASTGYTIWVGVAVANLQTQPSNDLVKKRLDYAVSNMFKLLPK